MDKDKLMKMLSGAKQVMDKVESGNFEPTNKSLSESVNQYGGEELLESLPEGMTPNSTPTNPTRPMGNSYKNYETSTMPDHIKKAMVDFPIPKMEMGSGGGPSFSLDDVGDLAKKSPVQAQAQPQTTQVNESRIVNSQGQLLITMTENELDKKIQEALLNFMATTFTKNLTENTIKKTITTLIKEGKLKVKSNPKIK